MKLIDYLTRFPEKTQVLIVAMDVSASVLYQWKMELRSVPVRKCIKLEQATEGMVTRKDTRPNDWMDIWPELSARLGASDHIDVNQTASLEFASANSPTLDAM